MSELAGVCLCISWAVKTAGVRLVVYVVASNKELMHSMSGSS